MKILIVEDSHEIVETVMLTFQIRWPESVVVAAEMGEQGVAMVESEKPDVVILDLGLPDITGFEVLKQIRLFSDVPVLILTVRGDETDVVKGLEWGADDYVVKPFHQLELLSRVKALLRRSADKVKDTPMSRGDLTLSPAACRVSLRGKEIDLTPTESKVLYCLIKNAGQVVTHADLAEAIWGGGDDSPDAADSIKVYVRRLREKLETDPAKPVIILTKSGVGYQLA